MTGWERRCRNSKGMIDPGEDPIRCELARILTTHNATLSPTLLKADFNSDQ